MPKVNLSFYGLLRDGKLYEIQRTKTRALKAMRAYKPDSKHAWAIVPVQVIYG